MSHTLDTIRTSFDEEHLVANAGLLLPATLMQRLGMCELLDERVDLGGVAGAANVGLKGSALVAALIVGAKWINDVAVLRAGETATVLGHWVAAASTMGTFLRGVALSRLDTGPVPARSSVEHSIETTAG